MVTYNKTMTEEQAQLLELERQHYEEVVGLPRGAGDPDTYGYPGEVINDKGVNPDDRTIDPDNVPF
jgi:hypothetical protein